MTRTLAVLSFLIFASCGGGETADPTGPSNPTGPSQPTGAGPIASVRITVSSSNVAVGDTTILTATALDANGRTVSGAVFEWSHGATNIAKLLTFSGSTVRVTGVSIGTAPITAVEQSTRISHTGGLRISAPPRPAGSFLIPHAIQIPNDRSGLSYVSTLVVVDTAATGRDRSLGIVRTANADLTGLSSVPAAFFPILAVVTDCPNGEIYGASHARSQGGNSFPDQFWRIDPNTGILTQAGETSTGADFIASLTCDSAGMLIVGTGWGILFRFNPQTGRSAGIIRSATPTYIHGYAAIAAGPDGRIAAGMVESFNDFPSEEMFALINTDTAALQRVSEPEEPPLFYGGQLVFRGARLLGVVWGGLAEISVTTGEARIIRPIKMPQ